MSLYPATEPYEHGMLEVGDGHKVYWETCGNPNGKPALVLHGGPGSGCTPGWRRYFNPDRYRIVLFDQRGCGRSTPHASRPDIDLATNTTHHLIARHRAVAKASRHRALAAARRLVGHHAGTCLCGAACRPCHREGIATTTKWEVDWITRGVGAFVRDAWQRFRSGVPEAERAGSLVDAYHRLLMHSDPSIHEQAARDWCDWEAAIVALQAGDAPHPRYEQPTFRLGFARLVTHYWRHRAWLEDGTLVRDAHQLSPIPGILIHGRLDLCTPLLTPWRLAQHWPGSELIVVDQAGHDAGHPGIADHIVAATDRFATR